ncbi:OLC1v1006269C1 [Oldenlandia corymbosa var. corymbosa]|uniref:Potassium transporter n=1 Tax=Oldenlandia corymbosa var. corymbosa TaxID=529605 RepID=A0AAV1DGN8_OLDCO|nr:OLC1v1006269C1 [Oldenlandia corymbosa var. corymbosa]
MNPPPQQESEQKGSAKEALKKASCASVLTLAYQSLGVVYGDLSTSPLYVYKTTFSGKLRLHEDDDEIYGVLSFIFWTFTLIALCKYVFIVMSADDNGEGGTFALYSLLCRHARLGILPNQQDVDKRLSSYAIEDSADTWESSALKSLFEKHPNIRNGLLIFVLLGTCMMIGDGIFTPAISVLSAVSGIQVKATNLHENYVVVISCIILVILFSIQHHGTNRVAFLFAPIVASWLLCISGIGIYNIMKWNPQIYRALSPYYMLKFLKQRGWEGWVSLGGVVLSITGVETMFADLGHFSALSIKVAFTFLVYPCLILAYLEAVFWPVFVVATLAAVVGSQAVISAAFSIVSQCYALHCSPRVKIVHTSSKIHGQIYIPEVNWILMCLCLTVTVLLRDTNRIGHAYGLSVTSVMFVTTCLMTLVMIIVWKQKVLMAVAFLVFFGSIELLYLSSAFLKKHQYDEENKVSMERILSLGPSLGMVRVPGIGLVYTSLVTGIPAVFGHFVTNLPAFHQVLVFVCVKSVQVPYISEEERFLVSRIYSKEYGMYRCIIRYGYKDVQQENYDFENRLVCEIISFIQMECTCSEISGHDDQGLNISEHRYSCPNHDAMMQPVGDNIHVLISGGESCARPQLKDEAAHILRARESGMAYIMGRSYARAKKSASILKKFAIDIVYSFLSRNSRGPEMVLNVPHASLLEVGMVYHV